MQAAANVTQDPDEALPERPDAEHRALMARVAESRDRDAFEALFEYFGPRVKAMMLKGGADQAIADDIVQDVMLTVWHKVHLYSPERGSAGAWIFTIARNARIDRLRRQSSRPYEDVEEIQIECDLPGPADEVLSGQHAERVVAALAALPDDQRRIVEMSFMEDMPQSSIARKLSIPLGTVKSRMRLAYARLRAKLEDLK